MKPKIIVCGLGDTGYKIFSLLKQQGAAVIGINPFPIFGEKDDVIVGDLRSASTLIAAGVKEAHTLAIATGDDALNLAILAQARFLNPRIRIVNRLFNQTLGERLDSTLRDHFSMSVSAIAGPIFAFAALGNKAIGQMVLLGQTWPIREEVVDENHLWLGKKVSELWDNPSQMLIYYLPAKGKLDLISAVVKQTKFQIGDRILVSDRPNVRSTSRYQLQRIIKSIANLQQYQQHVRPVTLVTLILVIAIAIATCTYRFFDTDISIVDALYFSVGMITGAGGEERVVEQAPESIKIFTTILMLVGAGTVGTFYALINDFILGSRIRQFWDAARVPTHNHHVVCGLGVIGLETVRQLHAQGHEVAVIESNPNNRFLPIVRALGIPVIIEDASFPAALKAANVERAECLIAVTSQDAINVDIALTAKAVAPKLPVVVRSQDPKFARSIQEVFEFDSVLCPTDIATPSFAAAAIGGKIIGNCMNKDLLWVAVSTTITPTHPFCGKVVKEAAIKADFVPLQVETNGQTIHSWNLLDTSLNSGDILYLIVPATRLQQLWRSDRPTVNSQLFIPVSSSQIIYGN
jgi:Trk K+ transport system NAD-binding subunit